MQYLASWGVIFGLIVVAYIFVRYRNYGNVKNPRDREQNSNSDTNLVQLGDLGGAKSFGECGSASNIKKTESCLIESVDSSCPDDDRVDLAEVDCERGGSCSLLNGLDSPELKDVAFKIRQAVARLQESNERVHLFALGGVFGVDFENIGAVDFGDQLIDAAELRLRTDSSGKLRDIQSIFGPNESKRVRLAIFEAMLGMIENSLSNAEIVFEHKNVLLSKQRSLVGRNDYGDAEYSDWLAYCSRFSLDKLKGYFPLKMYMETYASRDSRQYIAGAGLADMYGLYVRQMLALIKNFSPIEPNEEVVSGEDFEKLLQRQIEGHFPDAYVELTPASGDHGADLIVDIDGMRLAIQAKYYKSNVGNAAVQEIHAGKDFYDAGHAMVVCDSGFTRHAVELADKLHVSLETTQSYLSKIEMLVNQASVKRRVALKIDFVQIKCRSRSGGS